MSREHGPRASDATRVGAGDGRVPTVEVRQISEGGQQCHEGMVGSAVPKTNGEEGASGAKGRS